MEDVARTARVSTATVSRALNSPDLVAPETLARVHRAIEKLEYRPNVYAQGLTTRKSRLLGILLPDIHGEYYSELLRGADAESRRLGYNLLVGTEGAVGRTTDDQVGDGQPTAKEDPSGSPGQGGDAIPSLLLPNVVGFVAGLAVMITEPNEKLWAQASGTGLPLVVIDESLLRNGVDRVQVDNQAGTREAVEHLLSSVSPESCLFIGGPRENFDTAERARVFGEVLMHHGRKPSPQQLLFGEYSVEWGRQAGEQVFGTRAAGPVGVLAGDDEIAFGVTQAAKDLGLGVPSDLRIVGFDDTRLASLIRPQLSTVRVPMAELGAAAVRMLVERVQDPHRHSVTATLPTHLIVRGTSSPSHPTVR
ncbi:MAG TPA: LacI family DNA-binding transcriptional regulator [Phycisphaerales bacterium]|nr:LacI family DNA-binding transcriptional regulator [Phycisphaerales bacterium]